VLQYLLSPVEEPAEMCTYNLELSAKLKCIVEANLLSMSVPVIMYRYTNLCVIDMERTEGV
jgi:hypothetical protein